MHRRSASRIIPEGCQCRASSKQISDPDLNPIRQRRVQRTDFGTGVLGENNAREMLNTPFRYRRGLPRKIMANSYNAYMCCDYSLMNFK